MQWEEHPDEWPWRCDDCDNHVDAGKTLCSDCGDRRMDAWREHQDRLREQWGNGNPDEWPEYLRVREVWP